MNAEFWAIIGVGVALAGLHWRVYTRLEARLDARIDGLGVRLDSRIDGVNSRIDGVNARLDALKDGVGGMKERLSRIEGWIAGRFREENIPAG